MKVQMKPETKARTMTAKQFKAILDRFGLSQLGAARLLGSAGRTVRRWASGECGIPPSVVILLKLMKVGRVSVADIEDLE